MGANDGSEQIRISISDPSGLTKMVLVGLEETGAKSSSKIFAALAIDDSACSYN